MNIISTQMKEILTSSTGKPVAKTIFGKIDVEEHQQADEEKNIVEYGATRAEGETETHLWEIRREKHQGTDEDKPRVEYGKTRTGQEEDQHSKVDHRIQGRPHAAVQQGDDARSQFISNLVYQIQNHPNKDALIADLQQNQSYNPFFEKSKKMIHDMGNVEYFEMCCDGSEDVFSRNFPDRHVPIHSRGGCADRGVQPGWLR